MKAIMLHIGFSSLSLLTMRLFLKMLPKQLLNLSILYSLSHLFTLFSY